MRKHVLKNRLKAIRAIKAHGKKVYSQFHTFINPKDGEVLFVKNIRDGKKSPYAEFSKVPYYPNVLGAIALQDLATKYEFKPLNCE